MSKVTSCESKPEARNEYRSSRTHFHRAGLPKKTQTYFFFLIDESRVQAFRRQLALLIPLITTTAQVFSHHEKISQNKKDAVGRGVSPSLLKISGVNIVFSQKGLVKVGQTAWHAICLKLC